MKLSTSSLIIILLLSAIACYAPNQANDKNRLIGEWRCMADSDITILFKEDSKCEMIFKENNKTIRTKGDYSVDFSKSPIPLSMTNLTKIGHPIHTIIAFIDDDTIEIGRFSPKWRLRPIVFEKDYTQLFKRM